RRRLLVFPREHVAISRERIRDRIERNDEGDRLVDGRAVERAVWAHDRDARVLGGPGRDADEERKLAAAGVSAQADPAWIDAEPPGVGGDVADGGRDVRARLGVAVVWTLAKVDADDDQSRRRERPPVDDAVRPVEPVPGAAVNVDQRGQRSRR